MEYLEHLATPSRRRTRWKSPIRYRHWQVSAIDVALTLLTIALVLVSSCDSKAARNEPTSTLAVSQVRVAVVWSAVEVSPDRRSVSVTNYSPSRGCSQRPAGVDVDVRDGVAYVSAWMTDTGPDSTCLPICSPVTQSLTLSSPLPVGIALQPPDDAVAGCDGGTFATTAPTSTLSG